MVAALLVEILENVLRQNVRDVAVDIIDVTEVVASDGDLFCVAGREGVLIVLIVEEGRVLV